jgi:hypothetical protein
MYKHLSDPNNYISYDVKTLNIHYYNSKDVKGFVVENNRLDLVATGILKLELCSQCLSEKI